MRRSKNARVCACWILAIVGLAIMGLGEITATSSFRYEGIHAKHREIVTAFEESVPEEEVRSTGTMSESPLSSLEKRPEHMITAQTTSPSTNESRLQHETEPTPHHPGHSSPYSNKRLTNKRITRNNTTFGSEQSYSLNVKTKALNASRSSNGFIFENHDVQGALNLFRQMEGLKRRPPCGFLNLTGSGNRLHPMKYQKRAKHGQCRTAKGMWGSAQTAPFRKAKYEAMTAGLGLREGKVVLDWGTGCGQELHEAAKEKGFTGVGVDLDETLIEFAKKNYGEDEGVQIEYCRVPGGKLPFPDGSFDAVISNAAVYHVGVPPVYNRTLQSGVPFAVMFTKLLEFGCSWRGTFL